MINIISSAERQSSPRGAKILLVGPTGVGKTSQLRTLDPTTTLFIDIEAGDLSVQDVAVDTVHVECWADAVELAASVSAGKLAHYQTLFVDSVTAVSRLSFKHAEQQPECIARNGAIDTRAAYGLHARQLQHVRSTNVIFCAILETVKDDFGRTVHQMQLEGAKTGRELPGIVESTYHWLDFGDGKPARGFVCTQPNKWNYPAKDRSGRLEHIEEPNIGRLISKLTSVKE